jgi:hypothetical protein
MGHQVCTELDGGLSTRGAADKVAAVELDEPQHFSIPQAEAIVRSAVTVLCPNHSALLGTQPQAWQLG